MPSKGGEEMDKIIHRIDLEDADQIFGNDLDRINYRGVNITIT
jgi:hypothetical protein